MKTIVLLFIAFIVNNLNSQTVDIKSYLNINHEELILYIDKDINSQLSLQYFKYSNLERDIYL